MKQLFRYIIFSILICSTPLMAQNQRVPDAQEKESGKHHSVHVSDVLNNRSDIQELQAAFGNSRQTTLRKSSVDEVGNERTFFVYNINTDQFQTKNFRLVRKGTLTQIWFEVAEINNGHLNESAADSIFQYLEEKSNSYSFNPQKGIIELSNQYLGNPPNYDGDQLVDFLITDIQDGWTPESNSGYVGGFFYSVDQFTDTQAISVGARSNERDILYIDSYPGIFDGEEIDPVSPLSTLSHEYQHLIHYNYQNSANGSEETFINEAQSNFASLLSGYFPHSSYQSYLNDTNVPLFRWQSRGNVLPDYGRAASFASYMWDQLGFENSGALTQNPLTGVQGIESTFTNLSAPFSFQEFLVNWGASNLLNDKNVDPTTGYEHPFLRNLRSQVAFVEPTLSNVVDSVEAGGILYIGFQQAKNLSLNVSISDPSNGEVRLVTKTGANTQISELVNGVTFNTPADQTYDQAYLMYTNTDPEGSRIGFTANVSGEQTYTLSTQSTFSENAKFYWPIPYYNASSVGRFGFSNLYTIGFDALIHSLELFIVSGEGAGGEQIGVKGQGTLRLAAYSDNNGVPGQVLAQDSVAFSEIGAGWQTFNVTDWDLMMNQGDKVHIVYELIVPTVDRDVNSLPLRLDDGTGVQNVTHVVTAPGQFERIFTDEDTFGQHGVWNNLVLAEALVTSTEEEESFAPNAIELSQNYPNPFNPETRISYRLSQAQPVELSVYNALGQKVATLVNATRSAGSHTVNWDASNFSSGLYIYVLRAGELTQVRKMVLMK